MFHLLTADIHLDDQPGNEYRWDVFNKILEVCENRKISSVIIAGDLSDKKDRHTGRMVNKLVSNLTRLTDAGISLRILRGNHDLPIDGTAYWAFLSSIPHVTFFDAPYYDESERVLYLPYTSTPEEDWKKVEEKITRRLRAVFLHQLVDGVVVNQRQMKGVVVPKFIQEADKVWAGDIHDPQKIGAIEYIGAPHPVSFGDEHKCRFVIVNGDYIQRDEILLTPPAKKIITIRSFLDLRGLQVKSGDQVRIRVELDAAKTAEWPALQDRLVAWAARKEVALASTEAIFRLNEKVSDNEKDITSWTNPHAILEAFFEINNITDDIKATGIWLLKKALETGPSSVSVQMRSGMLSFVVKSVEIENFCSFIKKQVIDFPNMPGLRLLTGINEVDPDLGANGAGKSSLWEAISFCLYGRTSDGDRGASLLPFGAKRSKVSVKLDLNGDEYIITRYSNPNSIEINGKTGSQEQIRSLIRLTDEQFYQSVLFGQGRPLFYDMSLAARDAFFNEILSLEIWEQASAITANRIKSIDKAIQEKETRLAYVTGNLKKVSEMVESELKEMAERHRLKTIQRIQEHEEEIKNNLVEKESREQQIKEILSKMEKGSKVDARPSQNRITEISVEIKGYESKKELIVEELAFYQDHQDCPVCRQTITEEFRNAKIKKLRKDDHQISDIINSLREKLAIEKEIYKTAVEKWDAYTRTVHELNAKVALLRQQVSYIDTTVKKLENEIAYLSSEENPFENQLKSAKEERTSLFAEKHEIESARRSLLEQRLTTQFWVEGFKRVRLFIASQILGMLTIETKTALGLLGLSNWEIEFTQEKDTKSGTTKPGVHIIVTEKESSRDRWSGGEQQRLRLSVSLAISNLIQRMNAIKVQMEIWDEPASYLSGKGTENLFEILAYRAETLKKTIWVIDHNSLEHPSILETWLVRKTNTDGSVVEKLSSAMGA